MFILGGFTKMMKKRDYRPKIHFSPEKGWMNDPNGMVYVDGVYHFFYQKYPYDTSWGPMHWGHATSRDLIHWEHQPIALYPDELGFIFSGSAVYDTQNSSEYGTNENPPIIAIYTSHHKDGLEQQSIAYSNDKGRHFEKSYLNPVIKNPGISDFRDRSVLESGQKMLESCSCSAGPCLLLRIPGYEKLGENRRIRTGRKSCEGGCGNARICSRLSIRGKMYGFLLSA